MKKYIFCLILFLTLPQVTYAFSVKAANSVYLTKDDIIKGNLYAAGQTITIEGKIDGDLICAGQSININGEIDGDLICAGQTINVNGKVGGSVRALANSLYLNNQIARNLMAGAATINLTDRAQVGSDMLVGAALTEVRGKVGNDLSGAGSNFILSGEIGGNVNLKIDQNIKAEKKEVSQTEAGLVISKTAKINGDLTYTSALAAKIETGATILGKTNHNLPKIASKSSLPNRLWGWGRLFAIFSSLVIGLVLISLWHEGIKKVTDKMLNQAGITIGWGLILMLLTPIVALLLIFTIIGIPLAFILLALWLIMIYLSRILVGILVGRSLLTNLWPKQKDSLIWAMIIGVIITYLIFSLPFIGWVISLLAIWWGLGGIWLYFKKP